MSNPVYVVMIEVCSPSAADGICVDAVPFEIREDAVDFMEEFARNAVNSIMSREREPVYERTCDSLFAYDDEGNSLYCRLKECDMATKK